MLHGFAAATAVIRARRAAIVSRRKKPLKAGSWMRSDFTALDVHGATFCKRVSPLPPDNLRLNDAMRPMFRSTEPEVIARLEGRLLEHRDRIYHELLELPVPLQGGTAPAALQPRILRHSWASMRAAATLK